MRAEPRLVFAFLFAVVASAGCSTTGGGPRGCPGAGSACSPVSGCCSGFDCVNGFCVSNNNTTSDMGSNNSPDLATNNSCKKAGDTCGSSSECCSPYSCVDGVCGTSDTRKPLGAACDTNTDCSSDTCLGVQGTSGRFCTQPCSQSSTCTALSSNPVYWCIGGSGGAFCVPTCTASSQCKNIGPDWSCRQGLSVENTLKNFCGVWGVQPPAYPCMDGSQCDSNTCNGYWCQKTCASNTDCGSNGKCVQAGDMNWYCFPFCSQASDCSIFEASATCVAATDKAGASTKVCTIPTP
jgi:hypothetical protein